MSTSCLPGLLGPLLASTEAGLSLRSWGLWMCVGHTLGQDTPTGLGHLLRGLPPSSGLSNAPFTFLRPSLRLLLFLQIFAPKMFIEMNIVYAAA